MEAVAFGGRDAGNGADKSELDFNVTAKENNRVRLCFKRKAFKFNFILKKQIATSCDCCSTIIKIDTSVLCILRLSVFVAWIRRYSYTRLKCELRNFV